MILEFEDERGLLGESDRALLMRCAAAAQEAEGVREPLAVFVRIVDDEEIREVNREQREKDAATDVLSFPTVNYPAGKTAKDCPRLLRREYDPEMGACVIGDILISMDHVRAQAAEYGHSERREAGYLLTHGLFHLMGYDHMTDSDKPVMRAMEEKALASIGLTREEETMTDERLLAMAVEMLDYSYSPYSHYPVGAALLAADGRVFTGCNIENAAFGNTMCAERTALFKAVSEGARTFQTIAIAAHGAAPFPCGACRQSLNEFAPDLRILVTWDGEVRETTLRALLPEGFGPSSLL
ncbi:MAG: cytidine deaminase [Christensenellales bacterium]|nr:cytidine deaminase [Christensenellales bacterium]